MATKHKVPEKFKEVEALDKSDRGIGGYGSTGLSKISESSMS